MSDAVEAVPSLGERFGALAKQKPGALAVTCGGESRTWRELDRRTNRIARALEKHGVREGRLLTIGLPNGIGFVEAAIAAWKLGAVPQPVSAKLPAAEIEGIVALADPPVVIGTAGLATNRPLLGVESLAREVQDDGPLPRRVPPSWKAPTSGGSTGRPKLIVSGHPGLLDTNGIAFWRVDPDGVALMPGPLHHNGPFASAMNNLMAGAHLVLMPKFDAAKTLELVERHRATWLYLVPAMMGRIWRLPPEQRNAHDLSSLRTVWHLAAPCPPWLKEAWIDWLGGEVVWELYAGTEAQAGTVINGTEWLSRRGSVGRVVYGEMRVLGPDGAELPRGEVGEIYLRRAEGAPPSYRYIGAEARRHGDWESLGDMGWMDGDGYVYLADRRTDMILVGGANVYPAEVEAALETHPAVLSSAVIGLPDEDLGSTVHAIVQARPDFDLDGLRDHLARLLAPHKRPRTFEIVDRPLRDEAGKVRRSELRAERLPRLPEAAG